MKIYDNLIVSRMVYCLHQGVLSKINNDQITHKNSSQITQNSPQSNKLAQIHPRHNELIHKILSFHTKKIG
jgi:hypothetical protein